MTIQELYNECKGAIDKGLGEEVPIVCTLDHVDNNAIRFLWAKLINVDQDGVAFILNSESQISKLYDSSYSN